MKTFSLVGAAVLGLTLATSALAQSGRVPDTGNMAYPTPMPQGNVGTTTVR